MSVDTLPMGQLSATTYSVRRDGSGTILFGSPTGVFGRLEDSGMGPFGRRPAPGVVPFRDIPDAERVYRLVFEQAGAAR